MCGTMTTPYNFMAPCLVKHRNNLALSFWWLTSVAFDAFSYTAYPFLVQLSNNGVTSPGFSQKSHGHRGCIAVDDFDL